MHLVNTLQAAFYHVYNIRDGNEYSNIRIFDRMVEYFIMIRIFNENQEYSKIYIIDDTASKGLPMVHSTRIL